MTTAPGRVNLMGDHTDYNHGLVLPMVIGKKTSAEATTRKDDTVRVWSNKFSTTDPLCYQLGKEAPLNLWLDYIQGVTFILQKNGYTISGFDLKLSSDIPMGSGLSSSAALEIAVLRVLREAYSLALDDLEIAKLGQKVETDFVGAPVGIMDQMAVSLGERNHALFINTANLSYEKIPLPSGIDVVIIDSGIAHHHATGGYKERRLQCTQAAELLNVAYLTDLTPNQYASIEHLPSPLNQRVKHVISENERVRRMVEAMKNENLGMLRKILYESHDSLRDDYAVSTPEIDLLVDLSKEEKGVIGARLTGGGFGGSIVLLAEQERGLHAASHILSKAIGRIKFSPRIICIETV
jgi:galactokinase